MLESQKIRYQQWHVLIEEQQASGLTQKKFCEQKNVNLSHFVYYRCRIKKNTGFHPAASFIPVKISNDKNSITSSEIKLLLPNGFQCTFVSHLDVVHVKKLVQALLTC